MPYDSGERGAEAHDFRLDAVGHAVVRVEPEGILADDDVRVGTAAGEEPFQALGEGAPADVEHGLRRVRPGERLVCQERVVVGDESLRVGAEANLGAYVGQERPAENLREPEHRLSLLAGGEPACDDEAAPAERSALPKSSISASSTAGLVAA
jgi:hypothetical protein